MIDKIKQIRRELHSIPECSGREKKTKQLIRAFLRDNTSLEVEDYGGGILAYYRGEKTTDAIALRADFDAVALPDGMAAHLCGHDGHTAALLGVAMLLEKTKPARSVLLIFQPAEETGEGAKAMTGALGKYSVSEIYGCHNLPGFEFGKVYISLDTFACASCGVTFSIKGKPAHAAYPETGISPIGAVTDLLTAVAQSRNPGIFEEGTFATLIGCNVGQKAFGTSAENAEVWVTVRSRTEIEFRMIMDYLEESVRQACERDGLSYGVETQDEFPATENDPACAEKILKRCGGSLLREPMRWSEDFGHYLNCTAGACFGIGAGNIPALHTEGYEYPDDLLEPHIKALISLVEE